MKVCLIKKGRSMNKWASGTYSVIWGMRICISVQKTSNTLGFLFHWITFQTCGHIRNTETHLSKFSPSPPCFPACVSESRTWSMYKFYVKALIVGFLFPSVMPFCPKEVQSFYQVSWDRLTVAPRQLSSDTVNAVLYIWKCTCILSFKTLQSA